MNSLLKNPFSCNISILLTSYKMQLKEFVIFLLDSLKILIIALAIVIPIRLLLFQPFVVKGSSMEPNYHSGDYLIIDELSYRFREPARDEVIVFKYPLDFSYKYIKRIIGLPGETIEIKDKSIFITKTDGTVEQLNEDAYITLQTMETWQNGSDYGPRKLGSNEYFVMGDNRNFSADSRTWGVLPREDITGKVMLRVSPFDVLVNLVGRQPASLNTNYYE